jgi:alpha-ribazole phosphatase/probable phosphoglycerate mutase
MVTILFEPHGTTFDNEAHLASGHNDVALSSLGEKQSKEMGERYKGINFDTIFCSDLQRAADSAKLAIGNKFPIVYDSRLRECDYGDYTRRPSAEVEKEKPRRITVPFPNGESYIQTTARMKNFLADLLESHNGETVMIIGHRATQYALENLINEIPLETIVPAPWKWQPGWRYELTKV